MGGWVDTNIYIAPPTASHKGGVRAYEVHEVENKREKLRCLLRRRKKKFFIFYFSSVCEAKKKKTLC